MIFVILRHISESTKDLYKECYKSIRKFYNHEIIIIDNYSNKEFMDKDFVMTNCSIIENELNANLRLYLPFYKLLHIDFDTAIIIHDGTIFHEYIDFSNLSPFKTIWHFDTKQYDDIPLIKQQLYSLTNHHELLDILHNRTYFGSLGACVIITKDFLMKLEHKYKISNLKNIIHSKNHACAFERTIIILGLSLYPDLKYDKSVCGEIGTMTWGLNLNDYKKYLNLHKKKPIVKLFGAR